jgi:hypothetical protein
MLIFIFLNTFKFQSIGERMNKASSVLIRRLRTMLRQLDSLYNRRSLSGAAYPTQAARL